MITKDGKKSQINQLASGRLQKHMKGKFRKK